MRRTALDTWTGLLRTTALAGCSSTKDCAAGSTCNAGACDEGTIG